MKTNLTDTVYEYGAMSSKFQLTCNNKLTAYSAMVVHYENQINMVIVYEPKECKDDNWFNMGGDTEKMLDNIFGGDGAFNDYIKKYKDDIVKAYNTIKRIT
ncbi:MAG: hypothetical protein QNK20_16715 [Aureibaculum sp.]|nr:hypothetical protein [Aureibaculum sp.]